MNSRYTIDKIERLSRKFVISDNGCWEWTASVGHNGYGHARVNYKMTSAHRHMYQAFFGVLPSSMHLDHLCRNRKCVNPLHLDPVKPVENLMRSNITQAYVNSRKTHCIHGHEFTVSNTCYYQTGKYIHRQCKTCHTRIVKGRRK